VAGKVLPRISKKLSEELLSAAKRGDKDTALMLVQLSTFAHVGAYQLYVKRESELLDEVRKRGIKTKDVEELEESLAQAYAAASRLRHETFDAERKALEMLPEGPEKRAVVYSLEELRRRKEAV
jgi:hypothetical protein